nr:PP2C family serine/threonine-protein phosphatase [Catenuloplanes japonicus]
MTLQLRSAAVTDRGLIRSGNQDCAYAGRYLAAVADGMGGMAAGEVASQLTIEAVAPFDSLISDEQQVEALHAMVEAANARIHEHVSANPTLQGMGTTLTALLFSGSLFALVHVGDSRAYLLRDGKLVQLTRDDTYVQMLVDEGVITEAEADVHPRRSVVTQALQGEAVAPAYAKIPPEAGDRWLLCSDGLSGVVSLETMNETMLEYPDMQECAKRLIDLALRAGGPDNITVVLVDLIDGAAETDPQGATCAAEPAETAPAEKVA